MGREAALAALQRYTSAHGDGDLTAHLQQVSSPFRAFINDQLSDALKKKTSGEVDTGSMSERLRSLRSRLSVTEAAVKSAASHTELENSISKVSGSRLPFKS